jgi:hypothetical protein
MRLEHYSKESLGALVAIEQAEPFSAFDKPKGLWISVAGEDDWPSWCHGEDFGLDRMVWRNVLTLREEEHGSRILFIDDDEGFQHFENSFSREPQFRELRYPVIDWPLVATLWQGIIIAPYRWDRRLDSHWYYGWDCASGCIWDPRVIASITSEPVKQTEEVADDQD